MLVRIRVAHEGVTLPWRQEVVHAFDDTFLQVILRDKIRFFY